MGCLIFLSITCLTVGPGQTEETIRPGTEACPSPSGKAGPVEKMSCLANDQSLDLYCRCDS